MLESDDEELLTQTEYDDWNRAKKDFQTFMTTLTNLNTLVMGLGVPSRHPSYILGRQPEHLQSGSGNPPVQHNLAQSVVVE